MSMRFDVGNGRQIILESNVNLENRRHQESPKTDMHPHSTPQTIVSPYIYKIISENAPLAETRSR